MPEPPSKSTPTDNEAWLTEVLGKVAAEHCHESMSRQLQRFCILSDEQLDAVVGNARDITIAQFLLMARSGGPSHVRMDFELAQAGTSQSFVEIAALLDAAIRATAMAGGRR